RAARPEEPLAPQLHALRVHRRATLRRRRTAAADAHRARSLAAGTDGQGRPEPKRRRRSPLERDPIRGRQQLSATALLRRHASRRADTASRALDGRLGLRARPHRRPPGQALSAEFVLDSPGRRNIPAQRKSTAPTSPDVVVALALTP